MEELLREAFDPQPLDVFKMSAIIGEEGKLVPTRSHADQQIKVTRDFSHRAEPPAFLAE